MIEGCDMLSIFKVRLLFVFFFFNCKPPLLLNLSLNLLYVFVLCNKILI